MVEDVLVLWLSDQDHVESRRLIASMLRYLHFHHQCSRCIRDVTSANPDDLSRLNLDVQTLRGEGHDPDARSQR